MFSFSCINHNTSNKTLDVALNANILISNSKAQGSGILFQRNNSTYVLTAAHIVAKNVTITNVDDKNLNKRYIFKRYDDVDITKTITLNGVLVKLEKSRAKVITVDEFRDLALLQVYENNFGKTNILLSKKLPEIGSDVYMVGNVEGQNFVNSVAQGITSYYGRQDSDREIIDQANVAIISGCSGGGIYLKNTGELLGIISRAITNGSSGYAQSSFTLYVPARIIDAWAKENNIDFIFDSTKPIRDFKINNIVLIKTTKIPTTIPSTKPLSDWDLFNSFHWK